jgi:hypothetical protein
VGREEVCGLEGFDEVSEKLGSLLELMRVTMKERAFVKLLALLKNQLGN